MLIFRELVDIIVRAIPNGDHKDDTDHTKVDIKVTVKDDRREIPQERQESLDRDESREEMIGSKDCRGGIQSRVSISHGEISKTRTERGVVTKFLPIDDFGFKQVKELPRSIKCEGIGQDVHC